MATSKVGPGDPDPALSRFEIEIQHFYVLSSVVKAKNAHRLDPVGLTVHYEMMKLCTGLV